MSKLPSLRTPDGPVKTLSEWREFARRDDCLARMVPSDLRCILSFVKEKDAEIERLRTLNAEMREALCRLANALEVEPGPRGVMDLVPGALEKARRALAHPTPDGCGREGKHQWGGPDRDREVCVNCGATRMLEGGDDG